MRQKSPAHRRTTASPLVSQSEVPALSPIASIPIVCHRCGGVLRVSGEAIARGDHAACPHCHGAFPLAPRALGVVRPDQAARMATPARRPNALSEFPPN